MKTNTAVTVRTELKRKLWSGLYTPDGKNFKTRFQDRVLDIRRNHETSRYVQHILYHEHEYCTTYNTTDILKFSQKVQIWLFKRISLP
jgi:2-phosphoglycerate kinase